ncbi:MAG: DUF927 domain-containing protein, partial [Prevotellaceae bacterium]|nr:DUF927 domain-containing protein [Prevotellaceae bacterium]
HQERHPSFWFNTKNGCFKCEGCGESVNATVFLSKIKNIDQKEAYKELLELAGVDLEQHEKKQSSKPVALPDYSVEAYATEKHFMTEWLKDECGITTGTDQSGKHIKQPYKDENGKVVATRKRYNPSNPNGKFKWQKGSTLCLYGLWKAKDYTDYAILVEGESDSQSLWMLDFPTLGVPGATNFQAKWVEKIANIPRLYLHIEPDKGGQTFRQQMISKLSEGGYEGEVFTFNLGDYGVKDPSELYGKSGMDAAVQVKTAMDKAEKVDLKEEAENLPDLVSGMPVKLREPDGWRLSDDGIFKYDSRTEQYKRVCRTPIIIVKRLRNIETDEEKIQIAFYVRGRWEYKNCTPSTIYQTKNIVSLSDYGAMINSENAKYIVAFLDALESDNIDRINLETSISRTGWITNTTFFPGEPGSTVIDVEQSCKKYIDALKPCGTLEDWGKLMQPPRERNVFRFILASAFAAPLLRPLKGRTTIVSVHCDSGGGKTAALRCATSVWGNDGMQLNFNATPTAIERSASIFNDCILPIDEGQLAPDNNFLNKMVYMIAENKGKARGNKSGGLQSFATWQVIAVITSEESIVKRHTKDGVSSRLIEIPKKPFLIEDEAAEMHGAITDNYAVAGTAFIRRFISADLSKIQELYKSLTAKLKGVSQGQSGVHIKAVSLITLADILASQWIFNEDYNAAYNKGFEMGKEILMYQPSAEQRNVNKKALQYIADYIVSNSAFFTGEGQAYTKILGKKDGNIYYILKSELDTALEKGGFDPGKTLTYLIEHNVIFKDNKGYSKSTYIPGVGGRPRCVKFDMTIADQLLSNESEGDSLSEQGFVEIDEDDDLPF